MGSSIALTHPIPLRLVTMLAQYNAIVGFVTSTMAATGGTLSPQLKQAQLKHLKQLISTADVMSHEDATQLQLKLQEPNVVFNETERQDIAMCIASKMCGVQETSQPGRAKLQHCIYMNTYLSQAEWDKLGQMETAVQRADLITDIMVRIGLRNPSEPTKVSAAILCHNAEQVAHEIFYQTISCITRFIQKKRQKAGSQPQTAIEFPVDGADFQKLHPHLFPDSPITSKIETDKWESRRIVYGSRSTQTSLKAPRVQQVAPAAPSASPHMDLMMQLMTFMQNQQSQQQDGVNIKFLPRSKRQIGSPGSSSNAAFPMLLDTPETPEPKSLPTSPVTLPEKNTDDGHQLALEDRSGDSPPKDITEVRMELEKAFEAKKAKTPKVKAQPKSKAVLKKPASSTRLVLGCGKCRWLKAGCAQCRNPLFKGKRGRP